MSENANNNIPLDDEDILDLTVVAKPGKPVTRNDALPEMGETDDPADFGADLDALLDSLGADGSIAAPAGKAAAKPVAAPIADQTPVDHAVDPDEEMAMPEMADIDSLLAGLGAEKSPPKAPAPMPEFDGILAQAQAAEAKKAEEEAAAMMAEQAAPPAQAAPSGPATPPAHPKLTVTITPGVPAKPKQAAPAAPLPAAEDAAGDALDLNELDALLDDILATAPEVSSPPAAKAAPAQAAPEAPAESLPAPEEADAIPVPDQAIMPSGDIAALAERVRELEESVGALESEKISEAMMEGFIDTALHAKTESLFAPGSPLMERICDEIRGRFAEGSFNQSLEKMAAAAAAKVIREEIAALVRENG